ncbi:unnamed protein product [Urochloa humidicola]
MSTLISDLTLHQHCISPLLTDPGDIFFDTSYDLGTDAATGIRSSGTLPRQLTSAWMAVFVLLLDYVVKLFIPSLS